MRKHTGTRKGRMQTVGPVPVYDLHLGSEVERRDKQQDDSSFAGFRMEPCMETYAIEVSKFSMKDRRISSHKILSSGPEYLGSRVEDSDEQQKDNPGAVTQIKSAESRREVDGSEEQQNQLSEDSQRELIRLERCDE
ncbi:hypothetical protein G7Y89_g13275 [Cudoniella acicularis]|uniref:Uncharacterized protein n=1 Tax=Cudoniella acicularis TaxID=354080 RepID=A0A8H4VW78_9HELO|nr:hypothetical protein G7Y89_g13275 [Cudoniella acicularis]